MPYFHHTQPGHAYTFFYENYRGERERRHIIFREVSWGSNQWYPELQFFFTGFDVDKNEVRSFAFGKIEVKSFSRFTDQELHNHLNPPPEEEPNSETRAAITAAETGEVERFEDVPALMKDLNE